MNSSKDVERLKKLQTVRSERGLVPLRLGCDDQVVGVGPAVHPQTPMTSLLLAYLLQKLGKS